MTPRAPLVPPMQTDSVRTQIGVRVEPHLLEQIDALGAAFGGLNRSETTRRLLQLGAEAAGRAPEPKARSAERAEQLGYVPSPEECVTILNYLTDTLNDHLELVARHYPVGAVAEAHNLGHGLLNWATLQAEQYGTTVDAMLARVKGGEA